MPFQGRVCYSSNEIRAFTHKLLEIAGGNEILLEIRVTAPSSEGYWLMEPTEMP
jgi:hypothetical protein